MSLISRKIAAFAKKIADLADKPSLGNSTLLKQYWDSSPEELRVSVNGIVDDLTSVTSGSSGAEQIGSAPISGVVGSTPNAQIADIKSQLNGVVLGQIPPDMLTHNILRQAMINGGFAVNQRVVSGTVTLAAGAYGHDRWKAGTSGCTYTFATVNNVTTITISAGSLIQVIEGVNLQSGTYTLSWTGTAQGKIGAGSFAASGVTGTAVGGTNLSIEFNVGTLSKVQFNFGTIALTFYQRSFAEELILCQRYYEKSYDYSVAPGAINSSGAYAFRTGNSIAASTSGTLYGGSSIFKVRKRLSPTMTLYSPNGTVGAVRVGGATNRVGCTANTPGDNGIYGISVDNTSPTVINLNDLIDFQWAADAEL